ncbi:IS66 family insertion sequence element accessory protein TnpB (plasmid) [Mycetohabitans rhizoxinica]
MSLNPMASALFGFGNRRRNHIKIFSWGGNGSWLFLKRLKAHRFISP